MRSHWYHAPGLVLSGPLGRSQAWFLGNGARNSPAAASNFEFASLELQRFELRLKTDRGKLCATIFGETLWCRRVRRRPPHGSRVACYVTRPAFPAIPSGLIRIGCAHVDRLCTSG